MIFVLIFSNYFYTSVLFCYYSGILYCHQRSYVIKSACALSPHRLVSAMHTTTWILGGVMMKVQEALKLSGADMLRIYESEKTLGQPNINDKVADYALEDFVASGCGKLIDEGFSIDE